MKDILETLKTNSEIDHEKYPTSNPIQERQPSRGSDKTPVKMSSQHQFTADNSRVGTALGSRESFLNASMTGSSSMNINNDNRFPSSPVSNTGDDLLEWKENISYVLVMIYAFFFLSFFVRGDDNFMIIPLPVFFAYQKWKLNVSVIKYRH